MVVNDAAFFLSHRLPVAQAARTAGWEVHIATAPGPAVVEVEAAGFQHHPIPLTRGGLRPDAEIRTFAALCRIYHRLRPDLVHHVTIKPTLYGGLAARLTGVPASVSAISGLGYVFSSKTWRARLLRFLVTRFYRLALHHPNSRVIVQNPSDRQVIEATGAVEANTVTMIRGSGVDLQKFQPQPEPHGTPIAMMAGRMLREKGVDVFAESATLLRGRGCNVRCVLVGPADPNNPSSFTETELQALNDTSTVEWWGERADMDAVIAQASIICLPTHYGEGVPKILLEAAACGRAIVATDIPGCREVVTHDRNGLLIPARDPVALADAIETLVTDAARRRQLGAAGRRRAESEFSVDDVVAAHLCIYQALLRSSRR
jgi:glycosyltransferase involved in cell wall biosynthesis